MENDIELLNDKINSYYVKYGAIPAEIEYLGNINFEPQPNDNEEYYVIDLNALENVTLNYGLDFKNITTSDDTISYDDVYIINEQSHHIYYARGIEMDGIMYYTNDEDDTISLIGVYASLNGNTLSFYNNEAGAKANADCQEHYYGNINDIKEVIIPWQNELAEIEYVDFVSKVYPKSTSYWFYNCVNLIEIKNIENLNTDYVIDMDSMFFRCSKMQNLDVSKFKTNNVTNMFAMFGYCSELTSIQCDKFDTSNVTNMYCMFLNCENLKELDLGNFKTNKVENMQGMFANCYKLESLNVSSFDTSNVTTMMQMFSGCSMLTNLDLTNFNTTKVTNMSGMFNECSNIETLNLNSFNTINVTDMSGMFSICTKLQSLDLSNFNTVNLTKLSEDRNDSLSYGIFNDCSNLKNIDISSFSFENVQTAYNIFRNVPTKANGAVIKVKDKAAQTFVLATTGVPSDWDTTNVIY